MTSLVSLERAGRVFDALIKTRACVSRISLDGEGSDQEPALHRISFTHKHGCRCQQLHIY